MVDGGLALPSPPLSTPVTPCSHSEDPDKADQCTKKPKTSSPVNCNDLLMEDPNGLISEEVEMGIDVASDAPSPTKQWSRSFEDTLRQKVY